MVRHFDDALAISHNSRKFTQISRRPRHSLSKPLIVRSYSVNNIDTCGTAESPSIGLSRNDSQVCGQSNTYFQNIQCFLKIALKRKMSEWKSLLFLTNRIGGKGVVTWTQKDMAWRVFEKWNPILQPWSLQPSRTRASTGRLQNQSWRLHSEPKRRQSWLISSTESLLPHHHPFPST